MTADPPRRRRSVFADRLREFNEFVFAEDAAFTLRGNWRSFFAARIGPPFDGRVMLEIGCNDASLLGRVAAAHPATAFVGIDWKCRAIHSAAERVAAAGLRNVALLNGRAQDISRIFAAGETSEIWIFQPDPCDKPRELRNRLMAEPFLIDVHRVLADGRSLVLKTDHLGYYQWVLGLFGLSEPQSFTPAPQSVAGTAAQPRVREKDLKRPRDLTPLSQAVVDRFDVLATSGDFWSDPLVQSRSSGRCFAGEVTRFESRFLKKRLPIYYLEIQRRSGIGPT